MPEKSVAEKLLIKPDYDVLLVNEPPDYRSALGSLPPNVTVLTKPAGQADFIQLFVTSKTRAGSQARGPQGRPEA